MIIVTTDTIEGRKLELIRIVTGSNVESVHVGKDILAGFKNLVGGEVKQYTEMLESSRNKAMARMIQEAEDIGADAIVSVRFTSSQVSEMASEMLIYGTAVKFID